LTNVDLPEPETPVTQVSRPTGTPEQVAANPDSVTGKYLLPLLQK
jgi:hypothetical protein